MASARPSTTPSKRRRANNGGDRGASSSLKGTCGIRAGKRNVSKKHSAKISNANLKWVRSYYRSAMPFFGGIAARAYDRGSILAHIFFF